MTYTPEQISQIVLKVLKEIEEPNIMDLSLTEKLDLAKSTSSSDVLRSLATDKDFYVRQEVALNLNYKPEPYKTLELTKVQYDAIKQLIDSCKNSDLLNINL